jgi:cytochrome c oxidase subunit II
MQDSTKNPNFVYELSCDQMCGKGHYSMRAVIIVESQQEHDAWLAKQKPYYWTSHPEAEPKQEAPVAVKDSANKITMNNN